MERSQVLDASCRRRASRKTGRLKLYGMKAAYDEIIATAVKRQHEPQQIVGDPRLREAACWTHLRRDFHGEWTKTKSVIAREALDRIGVLYDIEREIDGRPADIRLAAREKHSAPKVEAFFAWSESQLSLIPGKGESRQGLSLRAQPSCLIQPLP